MSLIFETSLGDLTIDFFIDTHPQPCMNIIKLSLQKFFVNTVVYEVQQNFIAKIKHSNKEPTTIYKELGLSKQLSSKIDYSSRIQQKGLVGLVNSQNSNIDSYFFITLTNERLFSLEGKFLIIGKVVEGLDILDQINTLPLNNLNRPIVNICIKDCLVIDDPFQEPQIEEQPTPKLESKEKGYLQYEEYLKLKDDNKMIQKIQEQDIKKKTDVLELIEYFPEANSKPSERTLFVAKLNRKTLDNELEEIFSQFGTIESCDIRKDWKTKQSLGYAFIQFKERKDAERAYFKMQNAVIDNNRIHVDFSQSVQQKKPLKDNKKHKIKKLKQFRQNFNHAHAYACSSFVQVYQNQIYLQWINLFKKRLLKYQFYQAFQLKNSNTQKVKQNIIQKITLKWSNYQTLQMNLIYLQTKRQNKLQLKAILLLIKSSINYIGSKYKSGESPNSFQRLLSIQLIVLSINYGENLQNFKAFSNNASLHSSSYNEFL